MCGVKINYPDPFCGMRAFSLYYARIPGFHQVFDIRLPRQSILRSSEMME